MAAFDTFGMFDGSPGYAEDFWRKMSRHYIADGVVDGVDNELAVAQRAAGANLSVDVATGSAFVRGHFGESSSVKNLPIGAADGTNPRIDRIIVRADFTLNTLSLEVLQGTPAGSPAVPSLTQSSSMWEIALAQVSVPALDTTIANAQITDQRTMVGTATYQPLDADLTAVAALTTAAFGRSLLEAADDTAGRTLLDAAESGHTHTGGGTTIVKQADESVASSVVVQDDNEFVEALLADTDYAFELFLHITAVKGFRCTFTVPAAAVIVWSGLWADTGIDPVGAQLPLVTASGTEAAPSLDLVDWVWIRGTVRNGANAGNLLLRWAQQASNVTATVVKAGSHMIVSEAA